MSKERSSQNLRAAAIAVPSNRRATPGCGHSTPSGRQCTWAAGSSMPGDSKRGAHRRQHPQRINREIADRHRDRHDAVRRQHMQIGTDRLLGKGGGIGLRRIEEIRRQVDHIIDRPPGIGERPAPGMDIRRTAERRHRARARRAQCAHSSGSGSSTRICDGTQTQHLGRAKPAGSARQQDPRHAGSACTAAHPAPPPRNPTRSAAVSATRRSGCHRDTARSCAAAPPRPACPALLEISVSTPLSEVVEQRIIAARRVHRRDNLRIRRVKRRIDRLEIIVCRLVIQQQHRFCRTPAPAPPPPPP